MNFLKNLNEEQAKAASVVGGPVLVLAGAGSGKTKTLTSRIAHLITECGVSSRAILAVTFTNKAAREMKKRVVEAIGFDGEQVTISTFHSFSAQYLRAFSSYMEYSSNFNIYDVDDQKKVISDLVKDKGLNSHGLTSSKIVKKISGLKERAISVDDFENNASTVFEQNLAEIYRAYQENLKRNDAMDFSDILNNFFRLINMEEVLNKIQDRFQYFMIDEYQDTNEIQHEIMKKLASKSRNIFVVGDEDQSIYGFRGADVSKILNFEKDYPETQTFKLERNYRSTKNILSVANAIIKNNTSSRGKELWTELVGEKVKFRVVGDGAAEARFITSTIGSLMERGVNYRDVAVLYRNNSQSRELEEEFLKSRIPYKIFGGMQFYQRKEVKDILAYLSVIKNKKDNLSFLRIVNVPHRGLGKVSITKLKNLSEELCNGSLYEALNYIQNLDASASVKASFETLRGILHQADEIVAKGKKVSEVARYISEETGYIKSLEEAEERDRIENIEELIVSIEAIENRGEGLTLEDYLEQISLADTTESLEDNDNYVKLMTIHNSKGLEFEVVFIVGLEEDLFPSIRSVFSDKEIEEERRLFYVALTRAKNLLYITSARNRMVFRSSSYLREISRFVKEIPEELVELSSESKSHAKKSLMHEIRATKSIEVDQSKQREKVGKIIGFFVGEDVIHAQFGPGEVEEVNLDKVTVFFKSGERKKFVSAVAKNFLKKN